MREDRGVLSQDRGVRLKLQLSHRSWVVSRSAMQMPLSLLATRPGGLTWYLAPLVPNQWVDIGKTPLCLLSRLALHGVLIIP